MPGFPVSAGAKSGPRFLRDPYIIEVFYGNGHSTLPLTFNSSAEEEKGAFSNAPFSPNHDLMAFLIGKPGARVAAKCCDHAATRACAYRFGRSPICSSRKNCPVFSSNTPAFPLGKVKKRGSDLPPASVLNVVGTPFESTRFTR